MTDKNIFVYKLFLLLNISDLFFFFLKLQPPSLMKEVNPLFPSNPPLKIEILSSPCAPFLKIWLEAQPPSRNGGAHHANLLNETYLDMMRALI